MLFIIVVLQSQLCKQSLWVFISFLRNGVKILTLGPLNLKWNRVQCGVYWVGFDEWQPSQEGFFFFFPLLWVFYTFLDSSWHLSKCKSGNASLLLEQDKVWSLLRMARRNDMKQQQEGREPSSWRKQPWRKNIYETVCALGTILSM